MKNEKKNGTNAQTGYTYDAFISYRHTDLDKFVAENLHRQMEAFRLPKKVAKGKANQRMRIERVFRDKDELPLTNNLEDPIRVALEQSEYLIVVCSPRLRESLWCKKEIETFIELHGRHKILAVLAEGEPDESFPEELLCWKEEVKKPDGTVEIVEHRMEPLAADVRGKNKKAVIKAMRTEILRLLAPMFDLSFDDLRQRHRERRMKRILGASLTVAAVCLAFGAVSTAMALRINSQNEQITLQNEQISAQNEELIEKQEQIQKQNEQLLYDQTINLAEDAFAKLENGDRVGALQTAVNALTEYEGNKMPYTAKAQYALTEGLHVYDHGRNLKALYQMETRAVISFMKVSPDGDRFFTFDQADGLVLWDVKAGKQIRVLPDSDQNSNLTCDFLGNEKVVYVNKAGQLAVYDISADEVTVCEEPKGVVILGASRDGKYVVAGGLGSLWVYGGDQGMQIVYREEVPERKLIRSIEFHRDNSNVVFYSYRNEEDDAFVRALNLQEQRLLAELPIADYYVDEIRCMDDTAWVLASCFEDGTINMDAALWSWDLTTGQVNWRQDFDRGGAALRRPYAEGAENLLVVCGMESYLIRMEDGDIYWRDSVGDTIAGAYSLDGADSFLIFARNGEYQQISVSYLMSITRMEFFDCHSSNLKSVIPASGGYLILPYQDNRVTLYGYSDVLEAEELQEPDILERTAPIQYEEARTLAEEMGLPKANLTQTIFYDEEQTICFVYYADGTLEIYQKSDMTLLASLSDIWEYLAYCYGRDNAGNLYVASVSNGFMLSPEYEILARIEGLQCIDPEGDSMVLKGPADRYVRTPIFTLEELLAKAREYVLRFE